MNHKFWLGVLLILGSVILAGVSQILLKISARRNYSSGLAEYLNPFVISGYFLLLTTTFLNLLALRWVPLSLASGLGASGQVVVPVLSFLILKEKISRRKMLGMALIIVGILIFFKTAENFV